MTVASPRQSPAVGSSDDDFARDFECGMRRDPRSLSPKYFYDSRGSELFDRICELDEYYPTRTEVGLLETHGPEIAECIGAGAEIVEFGAGSLLKIRLLLSALSAPVRYVPIDISSEHLAAQAERLARDYPALEVRPLAADFTSEVRLPPPLAATTRRVGFFPGSSIGNFSPAEALAFLGSASCLLRGGGLLIGVDLIKDPAILHRAYNDTAGVTAEFNKNVLVRANRELNTNFDVEAFGHYAFYNPPECRIEMHLVSARQQRVEFRGLSYDFEAGQGLHTENSYKYSVAGFRRLATSAGFRPGPVWCDREGLFSLHWLVAPQAPTARTRFPR